MFGYYFLGECQTISKKNRESLYSKFLGDLITRGKTIYISSLILSEFSNVLLRLSFKQWQSSNQFINKDFKKDFIGTKEYNDTTIFVKHNLIKILSLPNIMKISDDFHILDIDDVFKNFGNIDYNDSYIYHLASTKGYKIVTNDKDFLNLANTIDIITIQ